MKYKRPQYQTLKHNLESAKPFIQVLTGPRQVGKTTLAQQYLAEYSHPYLFASADAIEVANGIWIQQQWETARLKLRNSGATSLLLAIDEIQKINNWSEFVKAEWDKDRRENNNIKVILLGSSNLLLQKGLSESLTGRFEVIYLSHWGFEEMQAAFDFSLEQFIWFGGYPGAALLINDENRWKNYIKNSLIEPTLSKDIFMLNRVNKPALLRQLFELGCLYSGQILSFTKILGQLQDAGNTTTLSHYLRLLDMAGLLTGIEKVYVEKFRQKTSSPKFQVCNTALISSRLFDDFKTISENPVKWGRIAESAIGAHLVNFSKSTGYSVYYWRHRNYEIDFVLERNGKLTGIEVKSGKSQNAKGIQAFKERFHPEKIYLVGNGGIPMRNFLLLNPVELF